MKRNKTKWHTVEDDLCRNNPKPENMRSCVGKNCAAEWFVSEWNPVRIIYSNRLLKNFDKLKKNFNIIFSIL